MRAKNSRRPAGVSLAGAEILLVGALAFNPLQASDSIETARAGKGIEYKHERIPSVPWSIHVVKMARTEPTLEVRSMLARSTVVGLSRLSEQVLDLPAEAGTPLAAVNGDFYELSDSRYSGDPRGLQIVEGDLVSDPTGNASYCAFWIDAAGNPRTGKVTSGFKVTFPDGRSVPFRLNEARRPAGATLYTPTFGRSTRTTGGREIILEAPDKGSWTPFRVGEVHTAKVREINETGNSKIGKDVVVLSFDPQRADPLPAIEIGATLQISTATTPDLRGVRTAIGGGSVVTRDGQAARIERPKSGGGYSVSSMFQRHPRAAVGWSRTHICLVEVDGRQGGLSVGMTLAELGEYMAKLGCEEAINLDGGASATCWYRGRVVNSPCNGSERTIANGLVVVRKPQPAGN
jgi:exopolysaccharide biosynthesis protein